MSQGSYSKILDTLYSVIKTGDRDIFNKTLDIIKKNATALDVYTLYATILAGDVYMFQKCFEYFQMGNTDPKLTNYSLLEYAINSNNVDIVKPVIDYYRTFNNIEGDAPKPYILESAIKTNNVDIFNKVFKYYTEQEMMFAGTKGITVIKSKIPDPYLLEIAIKTNNLTIFNKIFRYYIEHGGTIDNNIFREAIQTGDIQIFTPVFDRYKLTKYSMTQVLIDASIISKNIDIITMTRSLITNRIPDSQIESVEPSAYADITKYVAVYNPVANDETKIPVKVVNFEGEDICPPELQPVDGKCPPKFPMLSETTNCCHKNMSLKKMVTIWKKTAVSSRYKDNDKFYDNRGMYVYTSEQMDALKLYSYRGDKLLSNFTTGGFKVNQHTVDYYNLHYNTFMDFNPYEETLKNYCIRFYKNLVSCFTVSLDYHIVLYRGISGHVKYDIGSYILINHFMSTGIDAKYVETFFGDKDKESTLLIIYIPSGNLICPVFDYSKFPEEKEVLLNCGSIFYINRIVDKTHNTREIEMTLVGRKELLDQPV